MKIIYIAIAILVLGGAFYFFNDFSTQKNNSDTSEKVSPPPQEPTNPLQVVIRTAEEKKAIAEAKVAAEAAAALAAQATSTNENSTSTTEVQSFDIGGENFSFDVKEIKVKEGDTVTINFTSIGGTHDWTIDEFNANTKVVNKDETDSITFVADKTGTYEYYCSIGTHRAKGMVGKLIVE